MSPVAPQLWVHRAAPDETLFKPVDGVDCLNKPGRYVETMHALGMWTSTFIGPERCSAWVEWCWENWQLPADGQCWVGEVKPDARVFVIDSQGDLCDLLGKYPGRPPNSDWIPSHEMFPFMDFGALVEDGFVGVHLTERGQWQTHIPLDGPSLYGWDCESTLWLRWAFAEWRCLGPVPSCPAR